MKRIVKPNLSIFRVSVHNVPKGGLFRVIKKNPEFFNNYKIFVFLIVFSTLGGLVNKASLVIAISSLIYLICSYLFMSRLSKSINIKREVPRSGIEKSTISATYTIENRGGFNFNNITFKDYFDGVQLEQVSVIDVPTIKAGSFSRVKHNILLDNGMGEKIFSKTEVEFSDFLNVFTFKAIFENEHVINVSPFLVNLPGKWERPNEESPYFGSSELDLKGDSTNFVGLRQYREGDPIRYINWRASQRSKNILVNMFDRLVDSDVTIFINNDLYTLAGKGEKSSLEYLKDIALSVSQDQIGKGNHVRVVSSKNIICEGKGKHYLDFLIKKITTLEAEDIGKDKLRGSGQHLQHIVPVGGTIIYLSTIHSSMYMKRDIELLKFLSTNRTVSVILSNPYEFIHKVASTQGRILMSGILENSRLQIQNIQEGLRSSPIFFHEVKIEPKDSTESYKELLKSYLSYNEVFNENF